MADRKAVEQELFWTRFAFNLEEKLGDLIEPEAILQYFSDELKKHCPYDYLEVSILGNSGGEEIQPANWIRNDTGMGGKLLNVILKDEFLRGLSRRHIPQIVDLESGDHTVENPELLKIMNLGWGILVPLRQAKRTPGVMKLFFQRRLNLTADLKEWLGTCGSILYRSLYRSCRYQRAEKLATIDGLTGLYNHRYFMDQMAKEFVRARRYRNWLALILIDIDYFKHYNDTNGHLAGDKVLKKVAQLIKHTVREIDLVARWGGEEFALLLPENNVQNGMIVAEKIRREVESNHFKNEKKQPNGNLTISLGVSQNSPNLKSHREMFQLADTALYGAKHKGRNRCEIAK